MPEQKRERERERGKEVILHSNSSEESLGVQLRAMIPIPFIVESFYFQMSVARKIFPNQLRFYVSFRKFQWRTVLELHSWKVLAVT